MFAVILGAAIAYVAQRLHEARRDAAADFAAALEAQFTLVRHRNVLVVLVRHLNEYRNTQERHLHLQHLNHDIQRPRLDARSLGFILKSKNPDLLNELMVYDSRFALALATITERNRLLEERVLDYMGQHFQASTQPDLNDWRLLRLKKYTDNVYTAADDALATNERCFETLRVFIKSNFPKSKPLAARVLEEATHPSEAGA